MSTEVLATRRNDLVGCAVHAEQLTKVYPNGVMALDRLDLDIEEGQVFGLLGPNGAGKSTTIRILTTTLRPTSGRAFVAGWDVAEHPLRARRESAVVFQDAMVDETRSARDALKLHAVLWGLDRRVQAELVDQALTAGRLVQLADRPVGTLSGGQRRRLEIVRALLGRPRVVFLDEPTVGLDPSFRHELWGLIARQRDELGTTVLLTTHYLDEAQRLSDRVAVLVGGRILAEDRPQALLATMGDTVVEVDTAQPNEVANRLDAMEPLAAAMVLGSVVTAGYVGSADHVLAALQAAGLSLSSLATRRPSLDDVYLRLTGASLGSETHGG